MKMFLSKYRIVFSVSILLVGIGLFFPHATFAQSPSDTGLETFAKILALVVNMFTFIAFMILNWGGQLMGTELLTGTGVVDALLPLWKLVRNITNLGFVLLLLYLVFANIVSSFTGQGDWTIKEKLPRIIFAMIAINFSFLVMRVMIDAVNVGATAILSVADNALGTLQMDNLKSIMEREVPDCDGNGGTCQVYEAINKAFCKDKGPSDPDCLFQINREAWEGTNPNHKDSKSNQTARNLFLAFGTHFQQLQKLPLLPAQISEAGASGGGFLAVLDNVVFSALMAIMYIISLSAVFIALLSRVLVLWIGMIASPALVAGSILGIAKVKEGWDMIVSNLIMPLKIAAAFTFSFIMISALGAWESNVLLENPGGTSLISVGPSLKQFFSNEYGFLWQLITIVTFWKAAFWAINDNAAQFITDKIKQGAESTGQFAVKALGDQQVIPSFGLTKDQTLSLNTLKGLPGAVKRHQDTGARKRHEQDYASLIPGYGGGQVGRDNTALNELQSTGSLFAARTTKEIGEKLDAFLQKHGKDALLNPQVNAAIVKELAEAGVKDKRLVEEITRHSGRSQVSDREVANIFQNGGNDGFARHYQEIQNDIDNRWKGSSSSTTKSKNTGSSFEHEFGGQLRKVNIEKLGENEYRLPQLQNEYDALPSNEEKEYLKEQVAKKIGVKPENVTLDTDGIHVKVVVTPETPSSP